MAPSKTTEPEPETETEAEPETETEAEPETETEAPKAKTLNIRTCAVCARTTALDLCPHCGHDVSVPADRPVQPLRESRLTRAAA